LTECDKLSEDYQVGIVVGVLGILCVACVCVHNYGSTLDSIWPLCYGIIFIVSLGSPLKFTELRWWKMLLIDDGVGS
jgi:hypothetical protein